MGTPAATEPGHRLNGWKEIAAHLGKGTRTAQRWEKDYALPVHRVGREGGEIVFAFQDEIDRWSRRASLEPLAEAEEPPPAAAEASRTRGRHRLAVGGLVAGAVVVIAALWFLSLQRRPAPSAIRAATPGAPAAWRLANGALTVLDDAGRRVFRHELGYSLALAASSADAPNRYPPARIVDLDGDGRPEVLLRTPATRREDQRFYCFEADGRLRFADVPTGVVRFGDTEYGDPWLPHQFFVTGTDSTRSLFVSYTHNLWFPARLRKLDPRGALLGEYWSNGFVEFVEEAVWRGRRVVLVGGAANDVRGASLAILDAAAPSGHSPSASPAHECHGCPEGDPIVRFTFPSLCLLRRTGGLATVAEAWVEAGDRLTVAVVEGFTATETGGSPVVAFYSLGPDLSLLHAEISAEFQVLHASLEKRGLLDHRFGARDEADMFPVRRFGPNGVVALRPVRVAR